MIYQDFALCGNLDVASNMFLGRWPRKGLFVDKRAMEVEALAVLQTLKVDVNSVNSGSRACRAGASSPSRLPAPSPSTPRSSCSTSRPPTCRLMATHRLLETMAELKNQGVAQIIISHRLQDIFEVGDRVMVLKRGRTSASAWSRRRRRTTSSS